jgi:hydrogenase expression/formation protein HypE
VTGSPLNMTCPAPTTSSDTVQLAHGGGGRLMRDLIEDVFRSAFDNELLNAAHDSAMFEMPAGRQAFTTDGYVVSPLIFPGGDIGKLAVCGTVNDLAMAGAIPQYLSAGFILEEGLPIATLRRVVQTMCEAAEDAGVVIATGDTKVVDRGKCDGLFITTAGVGRIPAGVNVSPQRVQAGDAIVLSGDVGRHGIAIMSVREGLQFEGALDSDCASLAAMVHGVIDTGVDVHCLRDLTRGGLAAALNEIAMDQQLGIRIRETEVPVLDSVNGACELLGLDPLYVANEGRCMAIVPADHAEQTVAAMRQHDEGGGAVIIGEVTDASPGRVIMSGRFGADRILDLLSGEQLPRIC